MANVKLIFSGTEKSETENHELVCYLNQQNEIYINININSDDIYYQGFICLDKSTAIKFAKTLRTEINKMEDVNNG